MFKKIESREIPEPKDPKQPDRKSGLPSAYDKKTDLYYSDYEVKRETDPYTTLD